jgi:hypothetical protein
MIIEAYFFFFFDHAYEVWLVARVDPMNIAKSYPENYQKDIALPRVEQDTCMHCYILSSCVQNYAGVACLSRYLTCTYNTS